MMNDPALDRLAARADVCRLLAACYYEPAPEFAEEGLFASLEEAAARVDDRLAALAGTMARAFGALPLEDLRIDYTRLFLHPNAPQALPYESSWTAGDDPARRQQATEAVRESYAGHGYGLDPAFRDLPDHIAAELEFVYALLFREAAALHAGDDGGRVEAVGARRAFLARHLGRWVPAFVGAMEAGAETGFYRSLAHLTRTFVGSLQD